MLAPWDAKGGKALRVILESVSAVVPAVHHAAVVAMSYPHFGSEIVATTAYTPGIGDFDYSPTTVDVGAFLTDNGSVLAALVGIFIVVRKAPSLVRRFAR